MNTNDIIKDEEVMEVIETPSELDSTGGFIAVVGIGLSMLVGGLAHKYIVDPMIAKIKAKKETSEAEEVYNITFVKENDEIEEIK